MFRKLLTQTDIKQATRTAKMKLNKENHNIIAKVLYSPRPATAERTATSRGLHRLISEAILTKRHVAKLEKAMAHLADGRQTSRWGDTANEKSGDTSALRHRYAQPRLQKMPGDYKNIKRNDKI
ncbi:hypothetical protein FISHEDRAFT_54965 [Fistulina hepatica ATCC 64428]|uniref:Uncharacterized protein n=1 Tax=Fistulina hepatica ATCC 64428 TaxID=1128425 RepID=A0A0D7A1K2_9AGAR|nr:hypothetical protein FISHEDRAFT_63146 [Fistulina hepatica ATCC 64428]KIY53765.1 hypothetical protein FISHEDRAFT_54965 [Fistulina hepatica ATCC 64428]